MLNAELKVVSGKQTGNVIPLVSGRFLIGREEDCHLRPGNDLVSRHHCVFKVDDYTVRVRDLGSTNGTFVNSERLRGEVMLNTGDHVRVGTLEFEVTIGEGAAVPSEAGAENTESAEAAPATIDGEPDASQTIIGNVQLDAPADATAMHDTASFQGDTVYQPPQPPQQPQYDPNQQQPMYGQGPIGYQMPYPQQPFMYGQPYGMPMGYPQQPMPYPQMGYPQQQMPQQTPPPPNVEPEAPAGGTEKKAAPSVQLPDPTQTGAKIPDPPSPEEAAKKAAKDADASASVNDIIRQYTQRRPGGTNK